METPRKSHRRQKKHLDKLQGSNEENAVNNNATVAKKRKMDKQDFSDLDTVYAAYCYLKTHGNYYQKQSWSDFIQKYLESKDSMVKWLGLD